MTGRVVFAAALLLAASAWAQPGAHGSSQADKQQSYTKDKDGDHRWINLKLQSGTPTPAPAAGRCMIGCFGATPGIQASVDGGPYEPIGTGGGGGCDCPTPVPGIKTLNGADEDTQLLTVEATPSAACVSAFDVCIDSTTTSGTHILNVPDAGVLTRGVITADDQSLNGRKTFLEETHLLGGATTDNNFIVAGRAADTPALVDITSDADTIPTTTAFIRLTSDAAYVFTSTPTLDNGVLDGQHVVLTVDSGNADCLTFTDATDLPSSGLDLVDDAALVLCAGQTATFRWDDANAVWLEEARPATATIGAMGATMTTSVCIAEDVTTAVTSSVQTTATIPAGTLVDNCLTKTIAAVSGGYSVGLPGAVAGWGRVTGTLNSTNRTSSTAGGPIRLASTEHVQLTSRNTFGDFSDTNGIIRVVCFCHEFGGF